jgi:hypothetical protein
VPRGQAALQVEFAVQQRRQQTTTTANDSGDSSDRRQRRQQTTTTTTTTTAEVRTEQAPGTSSSEAAAETTAIISDALLARTFARGEAGAVTMTIARYRVLDYMISGDSGNFRAQSNFTLLNDLLSPALQGRLLKLFAEQTTLVVSGCPAELCSTCACVQCV